MSNEFNLEQAKAGERVEFFEATEGKWIPVRVIGARRKGTILVEDENDCITYIASDYTANALRMAPKKMSVRYRVGLFRRSNGELYTWTADSDKEAEEYGRLHNFVCWLTDWQETEIAGINSEGRT